MLDSWLGDTPLSDFVEATLGRAATARPGTAAHATGLFQWPVLARLLGRPELDVLVVGGGREPKVPPPRDLGALRPLLRRGLGLVIRRAERQDAGLAALGRELAQELRGRVHVQLFVTPAQTTSFGWHYDTEDVFVVQTRGEKDYYFRRNTIDPEPTPGAQPDFGRVREEASPTMTSTLLPGDWLYLPRGWWHVARARTHSLSISLGVDRSATAHQPST